MTFRKGQSGNPGGRAKGLERQVRELAGGRIATMTIALCDIAEGKLPIGIEGPIRPSDMIAAYLAVTNRGWGTARQHVTIDDGDRVTIDWSLVPIERRRELLAAAAAIGALEVPERGDTEH